MKQFTPERRQRKALNRCRRFTARWATPGIDRQRLLLYRAWHQAREATKGWEPSALDAREYFFQFAFPHPCARELTLWDGEELVLVGLYDRTPNALSAIYCFYDPKLASLSPGVANVLLGIERAREDGQSHVYLGYRVSGCPSMRYKATFQPHELLTTRPGPDEEPRWEAAPRP